ncbi:YopX family protein [Latilactobacillus sakei]
MQEIKFRAWIKERKQMQNVGGIDFVNGEVITYFGDTQHGQSTLTVRVDDVELTQYTGLKNYAGAEIYDGDFMHDMDDDYYMLVHYEDGQYMCGDNLLSDCLGCDVVSNKFESPELLEGSE